MHFMHMHTFDAKEAMINQFQNHQQSRNHMRNSGMPPHHQNHHHSQQQQSRNGDYFGLSHDPMTAINNFDHDRHQSSLSNLPIPVGMFLNMAQVPPRFYNQQLQERGDNYHHSKKNYYRAGTGGMSQEHQGSASQGFASQNPMTQQRGGHSGMSGFSQTMSQMDFSQDMAGSSGFKNFGGSSVQDTGMLSQDSTYQGDRNPNATDGGFLSQL